MEYDLIEWHFQPLTGQEDKKLDLHSVISGESDELSYLVLLPTAPDGLYHFNVGFSIDYLLLSNPGKLIQEFSRNFSFPGRDTNRFLENSSSIFSKFQFPGNEPD